MKMGKMYVGFLLSCLTYMKQAEFCYEIMRVFSMTVSTMVFVKSCGVLLVESAI